jgi:hypothetical protein
MCTTKRNWYCPTSHDTTVFLGACFVKLNNRFAYIICKFSGGWDQCLEYCLASHVQLLRSVVFNLSNFFIFFESHVSL